jgi:hypothetical protein
MTVKKSWLVERLKAAVPCKDGSPSETGYEAAVEAAILAFSQRVPLVRVSSISIVAGTSTYSLPADFLSLLSFDQTTDGNVALTSSGIVPLGDQYSDAYNIIGLTLVFEDAPTFNETRDLRYNARHLANSSPAYPDLVPLQAEAVIYKATSDLLRQRAGLEAGNAWSYKIGDESIDKKGLGDSIFKAADMFDAQFERAVSAMAGGGPASTYGVRSDYSAYG